MLVILTEHHAMKSEHVYSERRPQIMSGYMMDEPEVDLLKNFSPAHNDIHTLLLIQPSINLLLIPLSSKHCTPKINRT